MLSSLLEMNFELPIGKPSILMPSMVSTLFVNCVKHSLSISLDSLGRKGSADS